MTNALISPEETSEPKSGLRARQRSAREGAILDAAHALIAEIGYDAMTMDDLAERAGISKPTLYHHFSSKEAIAVRAVVARLEGSLEAVLSIDPALPALTRFEQAARRLITTRLIRGRAPSLKAVPALMPLIKSNSDYQDRLRQFIDALCMIVDAGIAEGSVRSELPARLVVQMLISLLRDTDYDDLAAQGTFTTDEIAETLVSALIRGIRRS